MTNAPGTKDKASAGDPIPARCSVIEVHVGELKQLFNAIDPSPFRDKDLDPKAEEFIVGWAKELPRDAKLALVVDLDREAGLPDEAAVLRDAIHEFFSQRAKAYGRRLRELFRVGRTSLVIGLVALASAIALGDFLSALMQAAVLVRSFAKALRSAAGFPCGALSRFSCTTGGRFAVKLGFLSGSQRCLYASDTRTPQVPMPGEKTGRRCRHEGNGRAARPNHGL
jgi:hypothetical protein